MTGSYDGNVGMWLYVDARGVIIARRRPSDRVQVVYFAAVKACVDGLVDAGIWPDDTPDWVTTTEPVLNVIGRKTVPQVIITLTERVT